MDSTYQQGLAGQSNCVPSTQLAGRKKLRRAARVEWRTVVCKADRVGLLSAGGQDALTATLTTMRSIIPHTSDL